MTTSIPLQIHALAIAESAYLLYQLSAARSSGKRGFLGRFPARRHIFSPSRAGICEEALPQDRAGAPAGGFCRRPAAPAFLPRAFFPVGRSPAPPRTLQLSRARFCHVLPPGKRRQNEDFSSAYKLLSPLARKEGHTPAVRSAPPALCSPRKDPPALSPAAARCTGRRCGGCRPRRG